MTHTTAEERQAWREMCEKMAPTLKTISWVQEDGSPKTSEQLKEMLCDMVEKTIAHGDSSEWFYGVVEDTDPDGTPVCSALTGHGPNSLNAANFIVGAREALPRLLDEVEALRAMVREISELLREAAPYMMGGTPDLFCPEMGWDAFDDRVIDLLGRDDVRAVLEEVQP